MKKILIVTDFYDPHISGITKYIKLQIDYLIKNNYEVTILTTLHNNFLKKKEKHTKLNIIRVKPSFKISRGYYSFNLIIKFLNLKKHQDYIFVHIPLLEIFPLVFFMNNKTILFYHSLPKFNFLPLKIFDYYFYFFGNLAIKFSRKIVLLSLDYLDILNIKSFDKKKFIEIPPYILDNNITHDKISSNTLKFKIGYLGRLSFEKNLEILIEVSKQLTKKNYLHDLIIAGDDKDIRFKKYIEKLKKQSTDYPHISFIGKVKEEDKNLFYQSLNLFVLPSNNPLEAFGIVQLESMINNVPVIASNMPGVRTIISNIGSGALFTNKKELFDQITLFYLKKNKEIRIAEKVKFFYSKKRFDLGMKKIFL